MRNISTSSILACALLLSTAGCDQLSDISDKVEGITNSFVVEAFFLGVEPPEDETIALALEGTDFASGARATAFLADAAEVTDIENAPIKGAALSLVSSANGSVTMAEGDVDGQYGSNGDDGLEYTSGVDVTIEADWDDEDRAILVGAPPAPEPGIESAHTAGQDLDIDLSGQGFDAALVVVIDTATSQVVFSNEPSDITELYDFSHGEGEVAVTVPGDALGDETIYAVGVAGLVNADVEDFDNINTVLSTFMAGKFTFAGLCTFSESTLCE